jgi:UDP-glucose 4-epimerase
MFYFNKFFDNIYLLQNKTSDISFIAKTLNENQTVFEIFEINKDSDNYRQYLHKNKYTITKKNFDYITYINKYKDLKKKIGLNKSKAWNHWVKFGKSEGRTPYKSDVILTEVEWKLQKTYIQLLEDAIEKKYNSILVLTEDVILHKDIDSFESTLEHIINNDWDFLYLGGYQNNWKNMSINNYYSANKTGGSFAFAINNNMFKRLHTLISYMSKYIDKCLIDYQQISTKTFVMYPNIIINPNENNKLNFNRYRWDTNNYNMETEIVNDNVLYILTTTNSADDLFMQSFDSINKQQSFDVRNQKFTVRNLVGYNTFDSYKRLVNKVSLYNMVKMENNIEEPKQQLIDNIHNGWIFIVYKNPIMMHNYLNIISNSLLDKKNIHIITDNSDNASFILHHSNKHLLLYKDSEIDINYLIENFPKDIKPTFSNLNLCALTNEKSVQTISLTTENNDIEPCLILKPLHNTLSTQTQSDSVNHEYNITKINLKNIKNDKILYTEKKMMKSDSYDFSNDNMSNILVTGGLGYIGSHTVVSLIENNFNVIIIDNLSNSDSSVLGKIKQITSTEPAFYEGDVQNIDLLNRIFEDAVENNGPIDAVIHFAGLKAVGDSIAKPIEYYNNNIMSTLSLVEVMKNHRCYNLIFSSSATVYGNVNKSPMHEDMITGIGITNPYGKTKHMIENILFDLSKSNNRWNIICLRYFNPVGAHDSGLIGENPSGIPTNLMPYIMRVAYHNNIKPISDNYVNLKIYGNDYKSYDGSCVRDFIHVVDIASGHIAALNKISKCDESNYVGFKVYNLGTGEGISVLDLIKKFELINQVDVPFIIDNRREGDLDVVYCSNKLANKELEWKSVKSVDDMVRDAWNYQKHN